jgi:preprotein translocase subunit SecD
MLHFPRWKVILVLAICVAGVVFAAPNLLPRETAERLPDWLPNQQVSLGLDLQGGSHLLLEVQSDEVVRERLQAVVDEVRIALRGERIGYRGLGTEGDAVVFTLTDPAQAEAARQALDEIDGDFVVEADEEGRFRLAFTETALEQLRSGIIDQSIEIVRRRVDETGTREPTIQRQGEDRILVQLPGVQDPEAVKRLLGQTARLTFHLVNLDASVEEALRGNLPAGSMLVPAANPQPGEHEYWVVRRNVILSGDTLVDAQPTFQQNQPVVSFVFDTAGARRFGNITQENVGQLLAIVLDGEVISAPRIREPILGGRGVIEGNFTVQSANELALLLRAGALPAPLRILEERTVGPDLGADSIRAGEIASVVGLALVLVFMTACYGLFGLFANVALVANFILLLAALSVLQATLTLPGIAGIALTLGMAVDANVLIFERMREEVRNGKTPLAATDTGYREAMRAIIDANLTTLIAALMLFNFGSGPVRGFAVTLSIGIVTSMFTAIMVTRLLVVFWLRRRRPKALPI